MADGADRQLLGAERYLGAICDWKGKFGWIRPISPIDHPNSRKHGGKLYLAVTDVEEELEGVGAAVSYLAYADGNGLGAMCVRRANVEEAAEVAATLSQVSAAMPGADIYGPPPGCGGGGWGGKGAKGAKGGGKGNFGMGQDAWGASAGSWGGGGGGGGWGRSGGKKWASADPNDVCDRLHNALNDGVWNAAKQLTQEDSEWTLNEMTKRIVKYFYKAGTSPDLLSMPWPEAATQYIEGAMQGYSAACGDRPWFFELDLSATICAAIWEIVRVSHCPPRANYPEMEQMATAKYEELMDGILTEKAMWDSAQEVFGDEPIGNKVYKALKASHEASYTEACAEWRISDQQRVEAFVGRWMENSMGRCWQSIENSEVVLTPEVITRLFQKLVAPFGDDHPFSCVPAALTLSTGRPPSGWPFIWQNAEGLYNTWLDPTSSGPPSKRRKGAGRGSLNLMKWQGDQGQTDVVGAMLEAGVTGLV